MQGHEGVERLREGWASAVPAYLAVAHGAGTPAPPERGREVDHHALGQDAFILRLNRKQQDEHSLTCSPRPGQDPDLCMHPSRSLDRGAIC
jgi:hypothetical protein